MPDSNQDLIHLTPARIHVQSQGGDHVPHGFDGGIQVIVSFLPSNIINLCVQLCVHLVLEIDDVLGQVLLFLLHLLQSIRHILHPRVMVFQGLLDVSNVQAHGGNLCSHRGFNPLATGDDGVCCIHTSTHL